MLRKLLSFRALPLSSRIRFNSEQTGNDITLNEYHEASDNTLEELSEKLDSALESHAGADVSLSNGVLTFSIDDENTYVINKQTPNRQLWLSSPVSGPMRFNLVQGRWVEKRSESDLKKVLSRELSELLNSKVHLSD